MSRPPRHTPHRPVSHVAAAGQGRLTRQVTMERPEDSVPGGPPSRGSRSGEGSELPDVADRRRLPWLTQVTVTIALLLEVSWGIVTWAGWRACVIALSGTVPTGREASEALTLGLIDVGCTLGGIIVGPILFLWGILYAVGVALSRRRS